MRAGFCTVRDVDGGGLSGGIRSRSRHLVSGRAGPGSGQGAAEGVLLGPALGSLLYAYAYAYGTAG